MDKRKIWIILLTLAVYLGSSIISYALFSKSALVEKEKISSPVQKNVSTDGRIVFDETQAKTESCPLNGALYSKEQREWWEKHGPLGIMIENHEESRPQSGLSFADVIYEAVAEGGITRFLAMYYCQDAGMVGPVRSARTYFMDFVSEYGSFPLYAHVGGANAPGPADALSQIEEYGWGGYNDLNQFSIGCPVFCRYEDRLGHPVATEHTMYSTTSKLWDFAAKERELTNVDKDDNSWDGKFVKYSFKDDDKSSDRPASQLISVDFWEKPDYKVDWFYDPATNLYKRNNAGVAHLDKDTNKQLTAKNIVIMFVQEENALDGYENNIHLLYDLNGSSGKASIFMDGKQIKGTWKKDKRTGRTLLYKSDGSPIKFNRGNIWFQILPTDGTITVK
ncbi:MAG: DUF3048 domain-containing protein [Patescibacteria group bacterium]|nr:DUF3048 domain-containing protein [Patescibacteria group bacterium]